MSAIRSILALTAIFIMTLPGCKREEPTKVDLTKTETINREKRERADVVRIAVGGMITPKEGFAYYREFLDFIGKELGKPVEYLNGCRRHGRHDRVYK